MPSESLKSRCDFTLLEVVRWDKTCSWTKSIEFWKTKQNHLNNTLFCTYVLKIKIFLEGRSFTKTREINESNQGFGSKPNPSVRKLLKLTRSTQLRPPAEFDEQSQLLRRSLRPDQLSATPAASSKEAAVLSRSGWGEHAARQLPLRHLCPCKWPLQACSTEYVIHSGLILAQ